MYPRGLDMFGNSQSMRSEEFCEWGIKFRTNEQARAAYHEAVDPVFMGIGLDLPGPEHDRHYM